jgi:hypothetical protein
VLTGDLLAHMLTHTANTQAPTQYSGTTAKQVAGPLPAAVAGPHRDALVGGA